MNGVSGNTANRRVALATRPEGAFVTTHALKMEERIVLEEVLKKDHVKISATAVVIKTLI